MSRPDSGLDASVSAAVSDVVTTSSAANSSGSAWVSLSRQKNQSPSSEGVYDKLFQADGQFYANEFRVICPTHMCGSDREEWFRDHVHFLFAQKPP